MSDPLAVYCPHCHAPAGQACRRFSPWPGQRKVCPEPHKARVRAAGQPYQEAWNETIGR